MNTSGRRKPQKNKSSVRTYGRTEQRTYVQVYTTSEISAFIILIGIEKPIVRAKGINHPKWRTHGVLTPCSSASLLSFQAPLTGSGKTPGEWRCNTRALNRARCRYNTFSPCYPYTWRQTDPSRRKRKPYSCWCNLRHLRKKNLYSWYRPII